MTLTYILVDFDNVKPSAADIELVRGDSYRLVVVRGPQQTRYEADLAEALHGMGNQVSFTRCAKAGKNAADMQIAFHLGELVAAMPAGSRRSTRYIVISRDRDFDPLVMHLQGKGLDATRAVTFKAALGGKAAEPQARATKTRRTHAAPAVAKSPPTRATATKATASKAAAAKRKPAAKKEAAARPAVKAVGHAVARTAGKTKVEHDPIARVIEGLQRKGDERPGKRKGLERFIESHLGRNLAPGQLDAVLKQLERDGLLAFHDNKVEYRLPKLRK
jgi:hypothetical protein